MPIPLMFSGSESAYVIAAKTGDHAAINLFLSNKNNCINNQDHARALLAACTHGRAMVVQIILQHGLLQIEATDISTLLYPALRVGSVDVVAVLMQNKNFHKMFTSMKLSDHIISMLEDMVTYNKRSQALSFLRIMFPMAVVNKARYPKGILTSKVLQPMLDMLAVDSGMQKMTNNRMPEAVSDLIFSFLTRMQPIALPKQIISKQQEETKSILKRFPSGRHITFI